VDAGADLCVRLLFESKRSIQCEAAWNLCMTGGGPAIEEDLTMLR
jgi:hypothetical protein